MLQSGRVFQLWVAVFARKSLQWNLTKFLQGLDYDLANDKEDVEQPGRCPCWSFANKAGSVGKKMGRRAFEFSEKDVKKYEQTEAAKSMCYSFYL